LILIRDGISWGISQGLVTLERAEVQAPTLSGDEEYETHTHVRGARVLGGAIFWGEMDLTHPLCYGYADAVLPLFRRGTSFYQKLENGYASPVNYSKQPVASGYFPRGIDQVASELPAITVHRSGSGSVVCMQDNLLFRGYWYGGSKLFANALFFSDQIHSYTKQGE
jgi:hypothetical protein